MIGWGGGVRGKGPSTRSTSAKLFAPPRQLALRGLKHPNTVSVTPNLGDFDGRVVLLQLLRRLLILGRQRLAMPAPEKTSPLSQREGRAPIT